MTETGIWEQNEANQYHYFSYPLARWIGRYLDKGTQIVDFGCGIGRYVEYLESVGFDRVFGVEGWELNNYEGETLLIADLSKPLSDNFFQYNKNVICLEVGEHIPKEFESVVLDNMCKFVGVGNKLIMSWAIVGQDGIGHVNCKPTIWVVNEIQKRGFELLIEDTLSAQSVIENEASYFRNTLLIFKKTV